MKWLLILLLLALVFALYFYTAQTKEIIHAAVAFFK